MRATSISDMAALNSRYTFDAFIIGASNELAAASAMAVAAQPGAAYNPFFLHGATGLGKTHLMQAVAHDVMLRRPDVRVCHRTADELVRECVDAIAAGGVDQLRSRYAAADALLVDDVHAVVARPDAQLEFAAIFRAMIARGAQVMLTSDRPPTHLGADATLARDFTLGRVVAVSEPTWEHRLAILEALRAARFAAEPAAQALSREVLELVATHVRANVRALEGALTRLVAHARLRGTLSADDASRVLGVAADPATMEDPVATAVAAILEAVAAAWRTTPDALRGPSRKAAEPRQVAAYLMRELLDLTLADVGRQLGGRDHSTVLHAVRRVSAGVEQPGSFADRVRTLREALGGQA